MPVVARSRSTAVTSTIPSASLSLLVTFVVPPTDVTVKVSATASGGALTRTEIQAPLGLVWQLVPAAEVLAGSGVPSSLLV
ncbi:MAG TPA: hypothetical protein VER11_34190 [Polyangiaceae bacterium]|nr:hypothetical protein [Polyangiaceae bacterium]